MPFSSSAATTVSVDDLAARLADDPWTLALHERRDLHAHHAGAQRRWLPRLRRLVEPPAPSDSFPAFLLALAPFTRLAQAIGEATTAADLDVGTADELQRFVDRYRDYLTTED